VLAEFQCIMSALQPALKNEETSQLAATTPIPNPMRFAVWAVVSIAFTLVIIQYSLRHGKLLYFPTQDDITYIGDGLDRLNVFYNSGVSGSFYYYRVVPPHRSAVGTYMASIGFAMFGFEDWAPYATNAIYIFAALWGIYVIMEGAKLWHKIAVTIFALCCPLVILTVNEFRPDLGCGLVTALGMVALIRKPFLFAPLRHQIGVGALFGAALLIKPSIFPGTIIFAAAAVILACVRDSFALGKRPPWSHVLKALAGSAAAAALVALPYFFVAWEGMVQYLAVHLMDAEHRNVWTIPGGWGVQLRYYLNGPGGAFLLGNYLRILSVLLVLGFLGILAARRRWGICSAMMTALLLALTYAVPSITPGKNTFGGATFSWLLLFSCILAFKAALDHNRLVAPGLPWGAAFLIFGTVWSVYYLRMPYKLGDPGSAVTKNSNQFVTDVFSTVMDKLEEAPFGKRRIFVTTYGIINYQLLKYLSVREDRGAHEVPIVLPPDRTDMKLFDEQMNKSELILASESGNAVVAHMMPSSSVQDESLALARKRPDLIEIRRFSTANGKQFHLFEKKGAFFGWYRSEGFGMLEGPYPDRGLPEFRAGHGPVSRLLFYRGAEGVVRLNLRCKSPIPRQQVIVTLDGVRFAQFALRDVDGFKEFSWPMKLSHGNHVLEFTYSDWLKTGDVPAAVVFESVQLIPHEPALVLRKAA
jgi:hypothetical protein